MSTPVKKLKIADRSIILLCFENKSFEKQLQLFFMHFIHLDLKVINPFRDVQTNNQLVYQLKTFQIITPISF